MKASSRAVWILFLLPVAAAVPAEHVVFPSVNIVPRPVAVKQSAGTFVDGIHGSRVVTGYIPLRQGVHKFKLRYFQSEGGAMLRVSWAASGGELQPLAGFALNH
jgi:hypothetical protein